MEEKSFSWLLHELSIAKATIRILEVGICRVSKLLAWYSNDSLGVVCKKIVKQNFKSKMILSKILNERVPVLEKYSPDKVICYLYHLNGMRIVKVKEAAELAENQLHGLQVTSIHQALANSNDYYLIYKLNGQSENGEIFNELTCQSRNKEVSEVKDSVLYEQALNLTILLSDFISKRSGKYFKQIEMDLVADSTGLFYILKVHRIVVTNDVPKIDTFTRRGARCATKIVEVLSDDSIEEGVNQINLYKNFLDGKKGGKGKVVRKQVPQNSATFLNMIAKTFERERKNLENNLLIKEKIKELGSRTTVGSPSIKSFTTQGSGRLKKLHKKGFGNIGELLGYLENTRPKIWIRDREFVEGSPPLASPMSDKILWESSEKSKKSTLKHHFLNSPKSFRLKFESDFDNYLKTEKVKLKNKITSKEKMLRIRSKIEHPNIEYNP